jgi:exodeoxyribonuclease VII large subunit
MLLQLNNQLPKELSVTEVSVKVKELLETNIGYVKVKGEISGLKIASSGHGYFNLKDNLSILGCTCWRNTLAKVQFQLSDGLEISVTGKITSYAGQSRYQLSVESIQLAGFGAIMQILKDRKDALEREGLFSSLHKKPLPFLPTRIGVITSITGAVIRDIIHRIQDRCPTHVIIWPVAVQGAGAAEEIAAAIDGFNALDKSNRPDIIIVARGGGSVEDLWAFNEEIVVRRAFASVIPIISAVGHEVDYTLIDLVADKRAPTPTAASEFAVPVLSQLQYSLNAYGNALCNRMIELIKQQDLIVTNSTRTLKYFISYVDSKQQQIDELGFRLIESLPNLLKFKYAYLAQFTLDRLSPLKILNIKDVVLTHQKERINKILDVIITNLTNKLHLSSSLLESLDYNKVLKRGFAIVSTEEGDFLTSKASASLLDKFNIKFFDGEVTVKKS